MRAYNLRLALATTKELSGSEGDEGFHGQEWWSDGVMGLKEVDLADGLSVKLCRHQGDHLRQRIESGGDVLGFFVVFEPEVDLLANGKRQPCYFTSAGHRRSFLAGFTLIYLDLPGLEQVAGQIDPPSPRLPPSQGRPPSQGLRRTGRRKDGGHDGGWLNLTTSPTLQHSNTPFGSGECRFYS